MFVSQLKSAIIINLPTKDAMVNSIYTDSNYGDRGYITGLAWTSYAHGYGPYNERSFIQFELSAIPSNATIKSATLTLFGYDHNPLSNSNACYLEEVASSWSETDVTWNNQPSTTTSGRIYLAQSTTPTQDYSIDVRSFIQNWVKGTSDNNGLRLKLDSETHYAKLAFASSDYSISSKHPELVVTYTN